MKSAAGRLTAALLEHLPPRRAAEFNRVGRLEQRLADTVAQAHHAWPLISLADAAFVKAIAANLDGKSDPCAALEAIVPGDLFLATACAAGDKWALKQVEALISREVGAILKRKNFSEAETDEIRQALREHLLLARPDGRPKIADYAGRGPLKKWVRVAAVNTALNLRRGVRKEESLDAEALERMDAPELDPETAYIQAQYGREFSRAFSEALATLNEKERHLLRLHLVDGKNFSAIADAYKTHPSTVTRWLAALREKLFTATREVLVERLRLMPGEFDAIAHLIQSEMTVSVKEFLGAAR